jgi:hypothetical protein
MLTPPGELNRQIADTTRGFFDNTMVETTSSSQKSGRRHTAVHDDPPRPAPSTGTRRTMTTYSSKERRAAKVEDDSAFAAFRDDERASQVSLPACFLDNADVPKPSSHLPAGTIQQNFEEHNPNVLFRDTGDTEAFNESSEERLVAAAREANNKPVSSATKQSEPEERESPFPWSPSEKQTQTPKSNPSGKSQQSACSADLEATDNAGPLPTSFVLDEQVKVASRGIDNTHAPVAVCSSPMVIIPLARMGEEELPTTQTSSRNRKRKSGAEEEVAEILNSDDQAIGLPQELYVPRPSRRRATAVLEQPIDYSVAPERAAKKRRTTMNDTGSASKGVATKATGLGSDVRETTAEVDGLGRKKDRSKSRPEAVPVEPPKPSPSPHVSPARPVPSPLTSPESTRKPAQDSTEPSSIPKTKPIRSSPTKMLPPSQPASASQRTSRRCATTIYEDHVTRQSPSLSQQQATRKSALESMAATTKGRGTRRTIVQEDEDDEMDELSKEVIVEKPAPKKRGRPSKADAAKQNHKRAAVEVEDDDDDTPTTKRGRNLAKRREAADESENDDVATEPKTKSKTGRKPKSKAIANSSDESEAEPGPQDDEDEEAPTPPKKKGRGRPPKGKPQPVADSAQQTPPDKEPTSASEKPTKPILEPADVNANTATRKNSTPTAQPEQPPTKPTPAPPNPAVEAKPSPSGHSPIKKNVKGIHRVGLNRRHRIPPLLKMVKPPPAGRREDASRVTTVTSVAELEKKWGVVEE